MKSPTAVGRLAATRVLLTLVAAALSFASLAAGARAAVIVVQPDSAGSNHLAAAITQANTNSAPSNTLVLQPGVYAPTASLPAIQKPLTINGSHALQATGNVPSTEISGAAAGIGSPLLTAPQNVPVTIEAVQFQGAGGGREAIDDAGTLTLWNVTVAGSAGEALLVTATGTAALNESTIDSSSGAGLDSSGITSLNNSDVVNNLGNGIIKRAGAITANNTLIAHNGAADCTGGSLAGTDGMDDDGSCGVGYSDVAYWRTHGDFPTLATNGGPVETDQLPAGSPTVDAGANCPTTDGRFFVNKPESVSDVHQCDIGAVTNAATEQLAKPTCEVTNLVYPPGYPHQPAGQPAIEQVTVQDQLSGLGPEAGNAAQDYQGSGDINPADAIDDLTIRNGSVAFSPFASPSNQTLVLTATKQVQGTITTWAFTAVNWAGLGRFCS